MELPESASNNTVYPEEREFLIVTKDLTTSIVKLKFSHPPVIPGTVSYDGKMFKMLDEHFMEEI